MPSGYHILAAQDLLRRNPAPSSWPRFRKAIPALAGGAIGLAVGGSHPILSALLGSALVKNAADVAGGEATPMQAAKRIRSHAVATVGALAAPFAPMAGYCAGVVVDNVLFGASWEPAPSLDDVRAGKAYISRGQKGASVGYVQHALGITVDGEFGPETEKAVKAFQSSLGVEPAGYVGANTLVSIDRKVGSDAFVDRGNAIPSVASAKPLPAHAQPSSPPRAPASSSSAQPVSQEPPAYVKEDAGFLGVLKRPLWQGSSLSVWQGGLLGLGGAALLGSLVSLAMPKAVAQ